MPVPTATPSLVLAVDLPVRLGALGPVCELARLTGWQVRLLHIVDPVMPIGQFDGAASGVTPEVTEATLQLEAVAAFLEKRSISSTVDVRMGSPVEEIIGFAERVDAEMIVAMGRKHHLAHRLVLGSVASKLVQTSPMPVLVVPQSGSTLREVVLAFEMEHPTMTRAANEVAHHLGAIGI